MPLGFWGDADGSRYRAAYFERFPGVWCHGDHAVLTEHDGIVILGRSDAVLNPGGGVSRTKPRSTGRWNGCPRSRKASRWVRTGREIFGRTVRATAAGGHARRCAHLPDPRYDPRQHHAASCAGADLSVPTYHARSAARSSSSRCASIHGRPVRNTDALANPEALEHFRDRPELAS